MGRLPCSGRGHEARVALADPHPLKGPHSIRCRASQPQVRRALPAGVGKGAWAFGPVVVAASAGAGYPRAIDRRPALAAAALERRRAPIWPSGPPLRAPAWRPVSRADRRRDRPIAPAILEPAGDILGDAPNHPTPADRGFGDFAGQRWRYTGTGSTIKFQDPAANTASGVLGSDWGSVNPYFSLTSGDSYFYMGQNGLPRGLVW
jgi:hypothetical protein